MSKLREFNVGYNADLMSESAGSMTDWNLLLNAMKLRISSKSSPWTPPKEIKLDAYLTRDFSEPGNARVRSPFNQWVREQELEKDLDKLPFASGNNVENTGSQGIGGFYKSGSYAFTSSRPVIYVTSYFWVWESRYDADPRTTLSRHAHKSNLSSVRTKIPHPIGTK